MRCRFRAWSTSSDEARCRFADEFGSREKERADSGLEETGAAGFAVDDFFIADRTEETGCGGDGVSSREYGSATRGGYGAVAIVAVSH